ncbi:9854_t:CDS:2 [Ambispora gerdemannii]|uniref:9854_t:CDS:1 n=1 Tax=Ambispora gerdemannii TaxID=144530 RepID=A0A9N9BP01_9GLOM|nr:9854_t:CDS:2 [Ambispora gerdemannii]
MHTPSLSTSFSQIREADETLFPVVPVQGAKENGEEKMFDCCCDVVVEGCNENPVDVVVGAGVAVDVPNRFDVCVCGLFRLNGVIVVVVVVVKGFCVLELIPVLPPNILRGVTPVAPAPPNPLPPGAFELPVPKPKPAPLVPKVVVGLLPCC